jgi:hypothetical protein
LRNTDGILDLTSNSLIFLNKAATKLWSEAPVFTYLITELAQNQRGVDNAYQRQENTGYVVMIASILLLTDARFIPSGKWHKAPGNCRLAVLHGLGVIESYWALDESKKVHRSEVTVFLESPLLNC